MDNNSGWKVMIPIYIGIGLALGYFLGTTFVSAPERTEYTEQSTSFNMLTELLNYIDAEYVDPISKEMLINNTVEHILQELDPHSYYISPEEYAQMNEPLEGNFDGIGIQFNIQKDTLVVIDPISGGPSQKVGVKAGDRIIEVNDSLIAGVNLSNSAVVKLLKGPKGTKVSVTIQRKGSENLSFTITRDEIPIKSVSAHYMLNENTGYIKVDRFGAKTTDEFMNGMHIITSEGAETVLVDLRGNGGGYMNAATDMLDQLFGTKELLVYTEGKARPKSEVYSRGNAQYKNMRVVVLIDESSASASEIFAGAIQDHDRGVVVGRRSFGKGLVQEQTDWPNGAATRLTIARYYTPSGRCIQKPYDDGVKEYNEEYYHRYENGEMLSKDSIEITDSLQYTTDNGRLVYGSGGIIPDIFVPIDTTQGSAYLNQLVYSGIIYDFAFDYADNHREELVGYGSVEAFVEKFDMELLINKEFNSFAESRSVPFDAAGYERSKKSITRRISAYIARNIWNDKGFYLIWNQGDPVIETALEANEDEILGK